MNEIHHALKSSSASIIRAQSIQAGIWPAEAASAKLAHDPVAINLGTSVVVLVLWRQWETLETDAWLRLKAET